MNKELQVLATIFQEHEQACKEPSVGTWRAVGDKLVCQLVIDPYYTGDDLERECVARRQLQALEEYLFTNHNAMWQGSPFCLPEIITPNTRQQLFVDRIKFCIKTLAEKI